MTKDLEIKYEPTRHDVKIVSAELHTLKLEPGDKIVIEVPIRLDARTLRAYRDTAKRHFAGHEVIVLDGGAKVQVLKEVEQ